MENIESTLNFAVIGNPKHIFSSMYKVKTALGTGINPDSKNPFYNSEYINLDHLLKKINPSLQKVGLVVMQSPIGKNKLLTLLFHKDHSDYIQFISDLILEKNTPQGMGSATTYSKRVVLQAIFSMSAGPEEDDDGNYAETNNEVNKKTNKTKNDSIQQKMESKLNKSKFDLDNCLNELNASIFSDVAEEHKSTVPGCLAILADSNRTVQETGVIKTFCKHYPEAKDNPSNWANKNIDKSLLNNEQKVEIRNHIKFLQQFFNDDEMPFEMSAEESQFEAEMSS